MEPPGEEVVELAAELAVLVPHAEWHCWRGENGLLYAWWQRSEPPLRWRGGTKNDVVRQVGEYVETGKRPDY